MLIEQHLELLQGKRVGLILNHTAQLSSGEFLVDALLKRGITVGVLFGPEHGVRGEAAAGEKVADAKDEKTGIPVISLYGKIRKPTPAMLRNVDVLVYDIQDVGARFYTYTSTMGLCMEAAAEQGIPFIVLDRPNPLGGVKVDGPIMEDSLRSFVGMYPIPVVYGLTCGELATMINGEGWLAEHARADLTVIRMEGWERGMLWDDTGLGWIPPSPNIRTPEAAMIYPATCFIEATNLSEGRGTDAPFQNIGAPFVNGADIAMALNKRGLSGVQFSPVEFTPASSKFAGKLCHGVRITLTAEANFDALKTGLTLINEVQNLYPAKFTISPSGFLRLMGSPHVYTSLEKGGLMNDYPPWKRELLEFQQLAKKYLLY